MAANLVNYQYLTLRDCMNIKQIQRFIGDRFVGIDTYNVTIVDAYEFF